MPYATPEKRKEWRKRAINNGYGKWLWKKRKCHLTDAKEFRVALETIMDVGDRAAVQVARKALKESQKRWDALGPPNAHGALREKNGDEGKGDTLLQALAKLGLS